MAAVRYHEEQKVMRKRDIRAPIEASLRPGLHSRSSGQPTCWHSRWSATKKAARRSRLRVVPRGNELHAKSELLVRKGVEGEM